MADRRSRRKRRVLILLAGLLTLAAAVGAGKLALDYRKSQRAAQALDRGMAAYAAGDHAAALPDLGQAVPKYMDRADVLYATADSRRRIPEPNGRHITSAIAFARAARDLEPGNAQPRLLLIELYSLSRFVSEALEEANAVLQIEPENATALQTRVAAYAALGRRQDAVAAAEALLEARPDDLDSVLLLELAMSSAGASTTEIAQEIASHASRFENNPRFLAIQARIALNAGDRAGAVERLRRAASLELDDAESLSAVVLLCDALFGEEPELFELASQSISEAMQRPELAPQVASFVLFRDWRLLQPAARQHALVLDPTDPELPVEALGWSAFALKSAKDAAASTFVEALGQRPASPARDAWLAILELETDQPRFDLKTVRECLERAQAAQAASGTVDPICPPAELAHARLLLASGDLVAAESRLIQLGMERNWLVARVELLQLLLDQDRVGEAANLIGIDPFLTRAPGMPQAFGASLASLVASGRASPSLAEEMLSILDGFVEADPENAELAAYRAVALHGAGRQAEAAAALSAINPSELSDRARILLARASGGQIRIDIDSLLTSPPTDPSALLSAALVVDRSAGREPALALFSAARGAVPPANHLAVDLAHAMFLDRVGDPTARATLANLAEQNPESMPAQLALLESRAAWASPDGLDSAVARLGAIAGPASAASRVYEARRLILFDPSDAALAKAYLMLEEAKKISWPNPRISELLADAEIRRNEPSRAIAHLGEAVQASPAGVALFPRLVLLLRERGDPAEAGRYLDVFLAQNMLTPELLMARADLALTAGRFQQALDDYRQLAARGDQRAEVGVANALVALGSSREAEAAYQALVERENPLPEALVAYADFLGLMGRFDRGLALLDRLPQQLGDVPRAGLIAEYYARHAPADLAEATLTQLADAGDELIAERLTAYLLAQGRPDDTVAAADRYLAQFPDNTRLQELRALARFQGAGGTEATVDEVAELAAVIHARDPDSSYDRLLQAMLSHRRGEIEPDAFIQQLHSIRRSDPTFLPASAVLVEALQTRGLLSQAADEATSAAAAVPGNAAAAQMAAQSLAVAGRFPEAEGLIIRWKALLVRPAPEPDLLAAEIALAQGQPPVAARAIAPWIAQLSALEAVGGRRPLLAATLALTGSATQAQALFPADALLGIDASDYFSAASLMVPSSPDAAHAWMLAGLPRVTDGPSRTAIAAFLLSLGLERGHSESLSSVLDVVAALEQGGQTTASTHAIRAAALAALGQREEAIAAYREAIAQNPEDLLSLNNLANLLAATPETAAEGAQFAQTALNLAEAAQLPPGLQANILDTLGVALLASGDPAAAGESFRRGLALDPTSAACQVGVVESLLALQDVRGARTALRGVQVSSAQANPEVRPRLERVTAALN